MVQKTATVANLTSGTPTMRSLCLNDIWRLARQKWEAAGRPIGDSSRFWLEAEQELLQSNEPRLVENLEEAAALTMDERP